MSAASLYDPFSIVVPVDSRLPNGGGQTLSGLYNLNPAGVSVSANNLVTSASNYGTQSQYSNSVSLTLSARPRNGLLLQGGFNTAQTVLDYCDIRKAVPEVTVIIGTPTMSPTNPYCHQNTGFIKRFTALGSYTCRRLTCRWRGR